MGSPDYIAPEQARNAKEADVRADLFSLGCTMFQLLTNQLPFPGSTIMEKLMSRASYVPPSISSLRADVPQVVSDIAAKLMRLDPAERFQTPTDLAACLASLDMTKPAEPTDHSTEAAADNHDGVEPDNTLNMFLDQLTAQAAEPPSSSSLPSTSRRTKTSTWIASGIAGACVLALLIGLAMMPTGNGKKDSADDDQARPTKREPVKKPTKAHKKTL